MKHYRLYLGGEWVEGADRKEIVNPATGSAFATVATVGEKAATQAVEAAQAAFASWSGLPAKVRADYLLAIAGELERRGEEIARIITQENGKPLAQSKGEIAMSADHLRWFGEEARRSYGRMVPHQVEGKRHLVVKTPVGVVGAISPWNFPLVLAVRKVAPALAAGCPTVLKPASQTPLCALAFAECAHAAGLPPGVFSVLVGNPGEIGGVFLRHPACRKITFTGSTEVGKKLIQASAEGVKRLSLELGGQAPLLVFADADMEVAVRETIKAKFRNTGQSCIAANRIYVERPVYDEFAARLGDAAQQLKVGDGLEPGVDIGPVIDQKGLDKALEHIEDARGRGAQVRYGGKRLECGGYFLEPTVLSDVPDEALCMREETFAPVAPITAFDSEDEAIERANASPYGLSAYAFTRDIARMFRLAERIEAGTLGINDGIPTTSQCPFGGFKESGLGRELGTEGLDAFLETKHVAIGI
jgi:succinate-semialdehyde dehydrogenase/glutarate-semialdehyde dehydrogenase